VRGRRGGSEVELRCGGEGRGSIDEERRQGRTCRLGRGATWRWSPGVLGLGAPQHTFLQRARGARPSDLPAPSHRRYCRKPLHRDDEPAALNAASHTRGPPCARPPMRRRKAAGWSAARDPRVSAPLSARSQASCRVQVNTATSSAHGNSARRAGAREAARRHRGSATLRHAPPSTRWRRAFGPPWCTAAAARRRVTGQTLSSSLPPPSRRKEHPMPRTARHPPAAERCCQGWYSVRRGVLGGGARSRVPYQSLHSAPRAHSRAPMCRGFGHPGAFPAILACSQRARLPQSRQLPAVATSYAAAPVS
jgi:hypothetical protein